METLTQMQMQWMECLFNRADSLALQSFVFFIFPSGLVDQHKV